MKTLMFGWEFPPLKTGGLGTACYGLTKGLKHMGVEITFVVPRTEDMESPEYVKIIGATSSYAVPGKTEDYTRAVLPEESERIEIIRAKAAHVDQEQTEDYTHAKPVEVNVCLSPYARVSQYHEIREVQYGDEHSVTEGEQFYQKDPPEVQEIQQSTTDAPSDTVSDNNDSYGDDLFQSVEKYTSRAGIIAEHEEFDIIHAHDWMTFQAGIAARKVSGKPLVIHVHSIEHDRTGGHGYNPVILNIEQTGTREADRIIAVSNRTKEAIIRDYGVPEEKISVVYNAIDVNNSATNGHRKNRLRKKMVLFLGRLTVQKGPDYFLEAAVKVLEKEPNTMFVMAGNGDMMHRMIERASDLKIGHKVLFPGFLKGAAVDRMYEMADVYVMPSVSEPFGITPLEAMSHGVPVVISKQSGVSEVIKNAMQIDFWDTDALASKITALLRYKTLRNLMGENGWSEMKSFSWDDSAAQCIDAYNSTLKKAQARQYQTPGNPSNP